LAFIHREQYDRALTLLQKSHGLLDVVELSLCKRDQLIVVEFFYNMGLCYQKLSLLDKCAACLETCLDHLSPDHMDLRNNSIAMRLSKLKFECKIRMQLCAILSQLHKHKEALEQAYESAKLCNIIVND
jgi:tetratricopeptide (TPR) repeat protein